MLDRQEAEIASLRAERDTQADTIAKLEWAETANKLFMSENPLLLNAALRSENARLQAKLDKAAGGWLDIATNPPPANTPVLLCWYYGHWEAWQYEAACYETGERIGGYSNVSYHGSATHWQPLPAPLANCNLLGLVAGQEPFDATVSPLRDSNPPLSALKRITLPA